MWYSQWLCISEALSSVIGLWCHEVKCCAVTFTFSRDIYIYSSICVCWCGKRRESILTWQSCKIKLSLYTVTSQIGLQVLSQCRSLIFNIKNLISWSGHQILTHVIQITQRKHRVISKVSECEAKDGDTGQSNMLIQSEKPHQYETDLHEINSGYLWILLIQTFTLVPLSGQIFVGQNGKDKLSCFILRSQIDIFLPFVGHCHPELNFKLSIIVFILYMDDSWTTAV